MRMLFPLLITLQTLLAFVANAADDTLFFEKLYYLQANTDYDTGLYYVYGSPVTTRNVVVKYSGDYCDIRLNGLNYTTPGDSQSYQAKSLGNGHYELQHDAIRSVGLRFRQHYWDKVDCRLLVYTQGSGPGTPGGAFLGVLRYRGGFVNKQQVDLRAANLTGFRFAIPAFCNKLELLSAGTVIDGVYYSATKVTSDRFRSHPEGSQGVEKILLTMNGPLDLQCDVPIYSDGGR